MRNHLFLGACLVAASAFAAETNKPAPNHTKVKSGPFKIEVTLTGQFAARQATPIRLKPKEWTDFTVKKVAAHGQRVKAGDLLVAFDSEKYERAVANKGLDLRVSALDLDLARESLRLARELIPMDLAALELAHAQAKEDLERFLKIDRPYSEKSNARSIKSASNYLLYAEEELKQLRKMYEADDLTEETEEIILKRARDSVERAQNSVESARLRADRSQKVTLPRSDLTHKDTERRKALELAKGRKALPAGLEKQEIALNKQALTHQRAEKDLARLKEDAKLMRIVAPRAGIVYYGEFQKGKWLGMKSLEAKLKPDGKVLADTVLFTIVQPRPLVIHATVAEKDLRHMGPKTAGQAVPTSQPGLHLPATIEVVSPVPTEAGKFATRLKVTTPAGSPSLVPGMTCKVTLVTYEKPNALTIPATALKGTGKELHVFRRVGQGKREKVVVKVGHSAGGRTEILSGLKPDDEVYLK